jgi:ring-1,2-phenylacetyl-CoA epoxidase subunit PaaD
VTATVEELRAAAGSVPDPELPMLTVADLGILRSVSVAADGSVDVELTPTFIGCPAVSVMADGVAAALRACGVREVRVRRVLSPPWSSADITDAGRRKLAVAGIAPPGQLACPKCGSAQTATLASFGPTPCSRLRRCESCLEPFEAIR